MTTSRRRSESGSTLALSVLALTIIAMIVLFIGTQTMSTIFAGKKARDNSVGMAAADSAIEKYRVALEAHLADEYDAWMLTEDDLIRLVNQKVAGANAGRAKVIASPDSWERAHGLKPAPMFSKYKYTVQEQTSTGFSFWQVYRVIPPGRDKDHESNLTVYFRAWATGANPDAPSTSSPRLFRAEYRPGYFSDFQAVSNQAFEVEGNPDYWIQGPIHSNGYDPRASWGGDKAIGISFDSKSEPRCFAGAEFSTSRNATIKVPGASCHKNKYPRNVHSRELDLLAAEKSFKWLEKDECNPKNSLVVCLRNSGPYNVRLGNNTVFVNGQPHHLVQTDLDSLSLTILLDNEVELSGKLTNTTSRAARVTIATRRTSTTSPVPRVFLSAKSGGLVGAANPKRDVVSVLAQGDIILPLKPSCLHHVNLAAISESGGITIPPQYATETAPSSNDLLNGKMSCWNELTLFGSYSSNSSLLASKAWQVPAKAPECKSIYKQFKNRTCPIGYPIITLAYDPVFYRNTPPAYPPSTPWATVKAKEANRSCIDSKVPTCA